MAAPPPKSGLLIEVGKDGPPSDAAGAHEATSDMDAALDDAFDAYQSGNKQAWRDAMSAAISAKVAEVLGADGES